MKKLIAAATCAALAAVPAAAIAKPQAKVYRGSFEAVGSDGADAAGKFGKAQLVDGKRNDKLSVHVRHAGGKSTYVFRLQQAATACADGAPGAIGVPNWRYRRSGVLHTSHKGSANSWARSHTFTADPGTQYFVGVYTATPTGTPGELVLCAKLTTKSAKGGRKPEKRGGKHEKHRGKHEKHRGKPEKGSPKPRPDNGGPKPGRGPEQSGSKPPHPGNDVGARVSR